MVQRQQARQSAAGGVHVNEPLIMQARRKTSWTSDFSGRQFVQRDDAHAAFAGGDEDKFGAAADVRGNLAGERVLLHAPRIPRRRFRPLGIRADRVGQFVDHRSPTNAAEALLLVPPLAVRETVDRPDRVAAGEVCDPGLLDGILPCLTGHLAQFGEKPFRLTDWRQRTCHLPCTDTLRPFLAG